MSFFSAFFQSARKLHDCFFKPSESEVRFTRFARISVGLLILLRLLALYPDSGFFFSDEGTLPTVDALRAMPFMHTAWIQLAPDTPRGWELYSGSTLLLVFFGWVLGSLPPVRSRTSDTFWETLFRMSGIWTALFFCISMSRNDLLWNSADKYLYFLALFLTLSPRNIPWGRRMIQLQSALLYLTTFVLKLDGPMWREGTATYPVLQLPEFFHGPLGPFRTLPAFIAASTWGTLVVEMALWSLIWIPKLRLPIAIAGILFHLSLDYALNIPLFPWISSVALLAHAWPDLDFRDRLSWLKKRKTVAPSPSL